MGEQEGFAEGLGWGNGSIPPRRHEKRASAAEAVRRVNGSSRGDCLRTQVPQGLKPDMITNIYGRPEGPPAKNSVFPQPVKPCPSFGSALAGFSKKRAH